MPETYNNEDSYTIKYAANNTRPMLLRNTIAWHIAVVHELNLKYQFEYK